MGQPGGPQVILEAPPPYEPQSNGSVEHAAHVVNCMARTRTIALEARIQGEVPVVHPILRWLVEHAGS